MTDSVTGAPIAAAQPGPFMPEPLPPSPHGATARKAVKLAFPFMLDGRNWTEIFVRRFTVAQIETIFRNYRAEVESDPEAPLTFPSFVDSDGVEVPSEVRRALDYDDMVNLQDEGARSLPLRFQR